MDSVGCCDVQSQFGGCTLSQCKCQGALSHFHQLRTCPLCFIGGNFGNVSDVCGSCHWVILCLLQDELAALKDKLEQKEAEVKRLQEKLVCKLKGEGIEILDRGKKKGGSLTMSVSVTSSEIVFPWMVVQDITDKSLNFHILSVFVFTSFNIFSGCSWCNCWTYWHSNFLINLKLASVIPSQTLCGLRGASKDAVYIGREILKLISTSSPKRLYWEGNLLCGYLCWALLVHPFLVRKGKSHAANQSMTCASKSSVWTLSRWNWGLALDLCTG